MATIFASQGFLIRPAPKRADQTTLAREDIWQRNLKKKFGKHFQRALIWGDDIEFFKVPYECTSTFYIIETLSNF